MENHLFSVCVSWQMELCISLFYQSWLKTAFLHFVPINCSHMLMFCFLLFFWRKYWSGLWKGLCIHRRILYDYCLWQTNILYVFNLTKRMGCCGTVFPSSGSLFTSPGDWHCDSRWTLSFWFFRQGIPKHFGHPNPFDIYYFYLFSCLFNSSFYAC